MTQQLLRRKNMASACLALALIGAAMLLTGGRAITQVAATIALDPTFGTAGKVVTPFAATLSGPVALVVQADGKLVVGAEYQRDFGFLRYLPDGSIDATFGTQGTVTTNFGGDTFDRVNALVLQPDGALVAAGMALGNSAGADFGLARYLPDGSLDPAFGVEGRVTTNFDGFYESAAALLLQSDGKLVAVGGPPFVLARYHPDGRLDAGFGSAGKVSTGFVGGGIGSAGVLQPDGNVIAAGWGGPGTFLLARYQGDGTLDARFGDAGRVTTVVGGSFVPVAVALQPDGKILVAGGPAPGSSTTGVVDFLLVRYNPDGSLDDGFGAAGKVTTDLFFGSFDHAHAMLLQPDGRILLAGGSLGSATTAEQFALVRYEPDGSLDATFGVEGKVTTDFGGYVHVSALAPYADGRLVAAGPAGGFALARYVPSDSACVVNTLAAIPEQVPRVRELTRDSGTLGVDTLDEVREVRQTPRLNPSVFRRLRDRLLARSPEGRRYVDLYAAHSGEVVRLMLADAVLRQGILDGLLQWQPGVAALVDGVAGHLRVTPEQARSVDAVLERLARVGSPALRSAIEAERRSHPTGLGFAEAVVQDIGR